MVEGSVVEGGDEMRVRMVWRGREGSQESI